MVLPCFGRGNTTSESGLARFDLLPSFMAGSYSEQARECFELHPAMAFDEGLMLCDRSMVSLGFVLQRTTAGCER